MTFGDQQLTTIKEQTLEAPKFIQTFMEIDDG